MSQLSARKVCGLESRRVVALQAPTAGARRDSAVRAERSFANLWPKVGAHSAPIRCIQSLGRGRDRQTHRTDPRNLHPQRLKVRLSAAHPRGVGGMELRRAASGLEGATPRSCAGMRAVLTCLTSPRKPARTPPPGRCGDGYRTRRAAQASGEDNGCPRAPSGACAQQKQASRRHGSGHRFAGPPGLQGSQETGRSPRRGEAMQLG